MADDHEWVPVEVLWDGGQRAKARQEEPAWDYAEDDDESPVWPLVEEEYRDSAHLSKRKRKKLRGEDRPGGR